MQKFTSLIFILFLTVQVIAQPATTFEDLPLPAEKYWNGSDGSGQFSSGGLTFFNNYNETYASWVGFSYSAVTDTTTSDWSNQYSAITGTGVGNSGKYGVGYASGTTRIKLEAPDTLKGFYVTNSTYAYLTIKNGDDFSKKFGGASGTDPDYFSLIIFGLGNEGDTTGQVVFRLADFTSDNPEEDYIVKTWEWVSLDTLGVVSELHFAMESTDNSAWGMNTPAYFCIDNVNLKEVITSVNPKEKETLQTMAWPNPFSDQLSVKLPTGEFDLTITDLYGRVVRKTRQQGNESIVINGMEGIAPGIYLLQLTNQSGQRQVIRLMKNR